MENIILYILSMNKWFSLIIIAIWCYSHFRDQEYYWKKYKDLDSTEVKLNMFRFFAYSLVWLLLNYVYKGVEDINSKLDLLSMIAYTLTTIECTIYFLNSFGILGYKLYVDKKFFLHNNRD